MRPAYCVVCGQEVGPNTHICPALVVDPVYTPVPVVDPARYAALEALEAAVEGESECDGDCTRETDCRRRVEDALAASLATRPKEGA